MTDGGGRGVAESRYKGEWCEDKPHGKGIVAMQVRRPVVRRQDAQQRHSRGNGVVADEKWWVRRVGGMARDLEGITAWDVAGVEGGGDM